MLLRHLFFFLLNKKWDLRYGCIEFMPHNDKGNTMCTIGALMKLSLWVQHIRWSTATLITQFLPNIMWGAMRTPTTTPAIAVVLLVRHHYILVNDIVLDKISQFKICRGWTVDLMIKAFMNALWSQMFFNFWVPYTLI